MATRDPAEDEFTEISVTPAEPHAQPQAAPAPAPQPRQPRRRTPNPIVDDVIHSGEIQPRSMIVKATDSSPRIEVAKVEISEPVPAAPAAAPAPAPRRKTWLLLVAAVVPAAAAIALLFVGGTTSNAAVRPPPPVDDGAKTALQAAAQFIGTTLDADARAALVRAQAMASSSMLRAGIETDPATLRDMAKDKDVAFPIQGKEELEIFQIQNGTRTSMLRLPTSAPPLKPPDSGKTRFDAAGGALTVVASAQVASSRTDITGQLVLAVPVDLGELQKRVAEHAVGASLIGLAAPVELASSKAPPGEQLAIPIELESKVPLTLQATLAKPAAPPPPARAPVAHGPALRVARFACLGLSLALFVGFVAASRRRV